MIDYPKVSAFCEIANCLSFTEAANRLYTTQSSLSKSVASLEKTLGCQLFIRSNRNVMLTPAGEYLYKHFKDSLQEMQLAAATARDINEGKRGHLSIGIYGLHGIVKAITDTFLSFSQQNAQYSFDFKPMSTKDARDLLISKRIDAVITKQHDVNLLADCDYLMLSHCRLVAVARSGHPLFSQYESPTLSDLNDYSFVAVSPSFSPFMYKMILETCEANGFTPKIKYSEISYYGCLMHVASSDYITIMDESDCCYKDALRIIPINDSPTVSTVLAWNRSNLTNHLRILLDYLKAHYQGQD